MPPNRCALSTLRLYCYVTEIIVEPRLAKGSVEDAVVKKRRGRWSVIPATSIGTYRTVMPGVLVNIVSVLLGASQAGFLCDLLEFGGRLTWRFRRRNRKCQGSLWNGSCV